MTLFSFSAWGTRHALLFLMVPSMELSTWYLLNKNLFRNKAPPPRALCPNTHLCLSRHQPLAHSFLSTFAVTMSPLCLSSQWCIVLCSLAGRQQWGLGSRVSQGWGRSRKQRALYFKHLPQLFHGDHPITI